MELLILLILTQQVGGAKMDVSKAMVIVELDKANNVIRQAKESSQKALSKEEMDKIKAQADEVLEKSAMIFTHSEVIN